MDLLSILEVFKYLITKSSEGAWIRLWNQHTYPWIRRTYIYGCIWNIMIESRKMAAEIPEDFTCKITILKRTLNTDWNKEFRNTEGTRCEIFSEGQEFIIESPWSAPERFCHWAWADIRTFIHLVQEGKFETFVSCCTDGFRPVFFKIERIAN